MTQSNAVAVVDPDDGIRPLPTIPTAQRLALALPTMDELKVLQAYGEMFAKSGLFPNVTSWQAAAAIIQYGSQLGIDAFTALKDIYWIKGKPTCDASLINSLIKRDHGGDALMPVEATNDRCTIKFKRREWDHYEELTVTADQFAHLISDPTRVTWKTNRQDMLWARCVSTIGRRHFSDTIKGLYTREEMRDAVEADWRPVETASDMPVITVTDTTDTAPTSDPIADRQHALTGLNTAIRTAFGPIDDARQVRDDIVCARYDLAAFKQAEAAELRETAKAVEAWSAEWAPIALAWLQEIGRATTATMVEDIATVMTEDGIGDAFILAALQLRQEKYPIPETEIVDAETGEIIS